MVALRKVASRKVACVTSLQLAIHCERLQKRIASLHCKVGKRITSRFAVRNLASRYDFNTSNTVYLGESSFKCREREHIIPLKSSNTLLTRAYNQQRKKPEDATFGAKATSSTSTFLSDRRRECRRPLETSSLFSFQFGVEVRQLRQRRLPSQVVLMTKPKLEKPRALSSTSIGDVNRITTNTRGSLQTSSEYMSRAQEFADARVHETLRKYHSNRAAASYSSGDSLGVDRSQWKSVKGGGRHHAISCYKKVSSRGSFSSLRRSHRSKKKSMSAKDVPPVSDQAELLAIGVIPGTLEDVLHGIVNLTPEAMQIESAHAQCDLLDSRVLTTLVAPSTNTPFRSLTLKWALRHHEVLSRHRDYVYMEATGVLRDPQDNGAKVGYHLVHSVTLSSAPELAPEMQIVRGHLSYCYLYRQHSETQVKLFFHGGMVPRGGAKDRLAFALMSEAVLASPSAIECAMMKKLAFSLRTKHLTASQPSSLQLNHREDNLGQIRGQKSTSSSSRSRASPTTFDSNRSSMAFVDGSLSGNPCRVCHRPVRAFFSGKVTCCEMCEEPVCNRCKVSKKVFVFQRGVLHPQKMDFCSECVVTTNRLNAGWVASQELTDDVRPSERSSSSEEEDHCSKSYVSPGSSSRNGGMSRSNGSRTTMSSDGLMENSASPFVVWLPTDYLHPRLTAIDPMDMELENNHPSDNDLENKGYNRCVEDSFIDTEAFVTLDDDDAIPMIDVSSEDEED